MDLHAMREDLQSINRDIENHHTSFANSFASLKTQLEQTSSTTESAILTRLDNLARQHLTMKNAWEQFSESSHIRAAKLVSSNVFRDPDLLILTGVQESDVKSIQFGLVQRPTLFRTICDGIKSREISDMAGRMAYRTVRTPSRVGIRRTGMVCTCASRTRSQQHSSSRSSYSRKTSWTVSMHSANTDHHHDCPHSAWVESSWSLNFRLAYYSRLLARAVQASVSFTKGAGGLSLSPTMRLRSLVPSESPAFALIGERFPWEMSANDIETVVNQRVQSLRQIFQDRKASPYDVDVYGNTLLHVGDPVDMLK